MMKDFGAYAVFAAEYTAPARKMFDIEHIFIQGHKNTNTSDYHG